MGEVGGGGVQLYNIIKTNHIYLLTTNDSSIKVVIARCRRFYIVDGSTLCRGETGCVDAPKHPSPSTEMSSPCRDTALKSKMAADDVCSMMADVAMAESTPFSLVIDLDTTLVHPAAIRKCEQRTCTKSEKGARLRPYADNRVSHIFK